MISPFLYSCSIIRGFERWKSVGGKSKYW